MAFLFFGKRKHKKSNYMMKGVNEIMREEKELDKRFQKPVSEEEILGREKTLDMKYQKPQRMNTILSREMILDKKIQEESARKKRNKKILKRKIRMEKKGNKKEKNLKTLILKKEEEAVQIPKQMLDETMKQEMILNKKFQTPIYESRNKELLEKHENIQKNLSLPETKKGKGFFARIFSGRKRKKFDKEKKSLEREVKKVEVDNNLSETMQRAESPTSSQNESLTRDADTEKISEEKESVSKEKFIEPEIKKNKKKIILKTKNKKQSSKEIIPVSRFKNGYVHTGIKGFDELFDKNEGIPEGISALIEGGPGSGKTVFCLATLNNLCKMGKKCLYMSFEESEADLIHHMEKFGWDAQVYIKKGLLRIKRFDAIDVSRSIEALLSAAKKELLIEVNPVFLPSDFEPDFLVIDSLTSIASAFSGQESRFRIYMEQLFRYLEQHKITNFLIREVSSPTHTGSIFQEQGEAVSFLSDGIIVLYNVIHDSGKRESALEILKMRGTSFSKKIVKMEIINGKGLFVFPNKILVKTSRSNFKLT